jgi:MFS transporter, PAT family, beta-lactamase induction signal transducer AmpG
MKTITRFLTAYFQPKLLVVLFLGFSSGLPLLLVGGTLGAWLNDAGLDKATIGVFALASLPYSFKFLWAPFIDRLPIPCVTRRLGQRRSWMLMTQLLLLASIAGFALIEPQTQPVLIAWLAVIVSFLSATQDIVIDAYRAEYLDKPQLGEGAAMCVFGYRLGMLAAGAGALALADQMAWHIVYVIMAGFMVVGMVTVLCASEPAAPSLREIAKKGKWFHDLFIMPFQDFMQRHRQWILILLFILFYRMPDGFISFITTPFFLDIGFTKSQVAVIAKVYGFVPTLVGMFLAGTLIHALGVRRCLLPAWSSQPAKRRRRSWSICSCSLSAPIISPAEWSRRRPLPI